MKKSITFLLILAMTLSFTACNKTQESNTNKPQAESNLSSSPAPTSSKENTSKDDASMELQLAVKDCEYKAMQTIVNLFGQTKIGDLGEYSFDYFTENGTKSYNVYNEMFKGKKLQSVGKTIAGYDKEKEDICTYTWFSYEGIDVRMQFNRYFKNNMISD